MITLLSTGWSQNGRDLPSWQSILILLSRVTCELCRLPKVTTCPKCSFYKNHRTQLLSILNKINPTYTYILKSEKIYNIFIVYQRIGIEAL